MATDISRTLETFHNFKLVTCKWFKIKKTFPDQRNERNWQVSRNQQMVGFELTRKTYEQQIIHKPQGSMGLFFSAMVFNEILRKAWVTNTKEKHRNYKLKMKSMSDLWETKSKQKLALLRRGHNFERSDGSWLQRKKLKKMIRESKWKAF